MRPLFLLLGAVLVVLGIVLLFVPVISYPDVTFPATAGPPNYQVEEIPGSSLTGSIIVEVSWSASGPVTLIGGACAGTCTNYSELSQITVQHGTEGAFSVNQPVNGKVFLGANTSAAGSSTVTAHFTATYATAASLLVVVGAVLVLAGAVMRPRGPRSASEPAEEEALAPEPAGASAKPPAG